MTNEEWLEQWQKAQLELKILARKAEIKQALLIAQMAQERAASLNLGEDIAQAVTAIGTALAVGLKLLD